MPEAEKAVVTEMKNAARYKAEEIRRMINE